MVKKRKPVIFIDDNKESKNALKLLDIEKITYITYHIKKFEKDCCGEVPTTTTPSVFAPDGVFKGFIGVQEYVSLRKSKTYDEESPSAYW